MYGRAAADEHVGFINGRIVHLHRKAIDKSLARQPGGSYGILELADDALLGAHMRRAFRRHGDDSSVDQFVSLAFGLGEGPGDEFVGGHARQGRSAHEPTLAWIMAAVAPWSGRRDGQAKRRRVGWRRSGADRHACRGNVCSYAPGLFSP